jgi:ribonuclease-3
MLSNFIDRIKLLFRKDKELYLSLYEIIGFYPHNIELYKTALLHKSIARRNEKGKPVNNERLEFLGDAILDAVVGDIVFQHFPGKREGFLTNTRSKLVQRETLNKLAQEMGINQLILSNGRSSSHNSYMGGNAFEALVGAIYLDRGYNACMRFMKKRILAQMINIDKVAYKEVNFKSKLIEWSQKNRVNMDFKSLEEKKDKNGSPYFTYQVVLEGIEGCTGSGFSKKESQQQASKLTLERLRKEPQFIDEVFAAKANRTKMEEVPVENVPDTEQKPDDFIIVQQPEQHVEENEQKHVTTFKTEVFDDVPPAPKAQKKVSNPADEEVDGDEFDLSDISMKGKSREDIIAEAEAAAWADA